MLNNPYQLDQVAIRMVKEPPLLSDKPLDTPESAIELIGYTLLCMFIQYLFHISSHPPAGFGVISCIGFNIMERHGNIAVS